LLVDAIVVENGVFSWGTIDADVKVLKKYLNFVLLKLTRLEVY